MTGTLYITGDPDADALLNTNGTALLIGMLLDQQITMEKAFSGPATLLARLGHLDPARIAAMPVEEFVAVCSQVPAIHRFPSSMGARVHQLCTVLAERYDADGSRVWEGVTTGSALYERLRELPGYGEEKSQIFIALLAKRMGVTPRGWKDAAGRFSDSVPRSVADVHDQVSLGKVRETKKAQKAAKKDKQDRPVR